MNVMDKVVDTDHCVGCGVCAAVCPRHGLSMAWSRSGELVPQYKSECPESCSQCLEVCPAYQAGDIFERIASETYKSVNSAKVNELLGYYLACYSGFSVVEGQRSNGASGGIATWFLEKILKERIVDAVVAVGTSSSKDKLFEFKILENTSAVRACSGSVYYPVEISTVLDKIICDVEEKKYAVIGLPCVVYAIRLAMRKNLKLKTRIKLLASLACGQLQNRFYTELISIQSGVALSNLSTIHYRRKNSNQPASNFAHVPITYEGCEGTSQFNLDLPFYLWNYRYFTQNACNYCDDIFGELADITFMDAWLPDFIDDYRGHSLAIVRNQQVFDLIERSRVSQDCVLKRVEVERIIDSQKGVIRKKKRLLSGRLYWAEELGIWYPRKRVQPDRTVYKEYQELLELTYEVQKISKTNWPKFREDVTTSGFWNSMQPLMKRIRWYERRLRVRYLIDKITRKK